MAVIKRADADLFAREAVSLHLGDLHREGDSLVAAARQQADAIVAQARAERDRLISGAEATGYRDGLALGIQEGVRGGRQEGYADSLKESARTISELEAAWRGALDAFEWDRARMIAEARRDIVRLAAAFAERVTRRAVALDETVIEAQLEAVVAAAIRPSRLVIVVHPDDLDRARAILPGLVSRFDSAGHAVIEADPALVRGSCIARMAGGASIDASIDAQITRLAEAILPPDRPAGTGANP